MALLHPADDNSRIEKKKPAGLFVDTGDSRGLHGNNRTELLERIELTQHLLSKELLPTDFDGNTGNGTSTCTSEKRTHLTKTGEISGSLLLDTRRPS